MDKKSIAKANNKVFQAIGESINDAIYDGAFDSDTLTDILEDYCKSPAAREYFKLESNAPRKTVNRHKFEEDDLSIGHLNDQLRLVEFSEKTETEA